jgi:Amt family ammonium transporter
LFFVASPFFGTMAAVFAQETATGSHEIFATALLFLMPLGFILFSSSAVPDEFAPAAAVTLLMTWSVAALAYFAVGFALNFGGVAQAVANPAFSALYWEWYPLDQSVDVEVARLWGIVALRGWALAIDGLTSEVWLLFLGHLALVGTAAMIPAGALVLRARRGAALLGGVMTGALIYPLAGNWLWGGGWLSNIGVSLGMGRGLLDFGGASVIFLAGSAVTLASLLTFRIAAVDGKRRSLTEDLPNGGDKLLTVSAAAAPKAALLPDRIAMPSAYLPILSSLGGGLLLLGWLGVAAGLPNPASVDYSVPQAAAGGVLAALAAALTAAVYSWFTTTEFNALMVARGLVAGLIIAIACAAFVPVWVVLAAGLVMGFILTPLIYFFEQKTPLADESATLATMGISALIGLLLTGLITGVEAQLQAQLLGSVAIFAWGFLVSLVLFQLYRVVENIGPQNRKNKQQTVQDEAQPVEASGPHREQVEQG